MEAYIYLIKNDENYYKIGLSTNIKTRYSTLQSSNANTLTLIHSIKTYFPREAEKSLHTRYKRHKVRIRGEWFKFNEHDITDVIFSMDCIQSEMEERKRLTKL
jgi:outer membrane translocation and assembly module TamA